MLRKFHASSLYNHENGLSLEEIDALQGRGKDNTHSAYFMEDPIKGCPPKLIFGIGPSKCPHQALIGV